MSIVHINMYSCAKVKKQTQTTKYSYERCMCWTTLKHWLCWTNFKFRASVMVGRLDGVSKQGHMRQLLALK